MDDLAEAFLRFVNSPPLRSLAQQASLAFTRLIPLIIITPLFGGAAVPRRLRMGLGVLLTAGLVPVVLRPDAPPRDALLFATLAAKEAMIGLTLAMFVLVLFEAFAAFGALADVSRGATIANVLDPLSQQQQSVLATFVSHLGVALFLTVGGHVLLIGALADSFAAAPLHEPLPGVFVGRPAWEAMLALSGQLFTVAVRLAAPVMALMLLLDVALGLLGRVAPQVQSYFVGLTIKGTLGLFVVMLVLAVAFRDDFAAFLQALQRWATLPAPLPAAPAP